MIAYAAVAALTALCLGLGALLARAEKRSRSLQRILLKTEQMANLGRLVPPLTHDVNTNLGVCVSAVTFLKDKAVETGGLFEKDALSRSKLEEHLRIERESCDLLVLNLSRAAELISSFKRVSVDNSSIALETFDLGEYIGQIVTSMTPRLRKTSHRVEVRCDSGISVTGKPGLVYQVITNLVSNALTHAFDEGDSGLISIDAALEGDTVVIVVRDNGKGMSEAVAERAFTPFFTTKRAEGGTGLGLSIVESVVRDELRGSVECKSGIGAGTAFTIRFPRSVRTAPGAEQKKEATE